MLWTLRRGDDEVCCEARSLPVGIEGRIAWNRGELYAFRFASGEEVSGWAQEKRAELEPNESASKRRQTKTETAHAELRIANATHRPDRSVR